MDHNFAVENHTAERYLIGELTETERDAYEEHFFCCTACAEEIKSASEFMEGARRVIQGEIHDHKFHHSVWGSWLNWRSILQPFPAMACLLLVTVGGFAGYQNWVVIPDLAKNRATPTTTAQLVMPTSFIISESRSGENSITVPKDKAFILKFDIVDQGFPSYRTEIADESDTPLLALTVTEKDTASSVNFLVPADALKSGKYSLVIRGFNSNGAENAAKGEPTRISFELNVQD